MESMNTSSIVSESDHDEKTTTAAEGPWCISVKAVGLGSVENSNNNTSSSSTASELNFTVKVSPDDDLETLYDQIEGVTGLTSSQQRLIYRGRLISRSNNADAASRRQEQQQKLSAVDSSRTNSRKGASSDDSLDSSPAQLKIKDIAGLCDGQTIHLVRKKETDSPANQQQSPANSSARHNNNNNSETQQQANGRTSTSNLRPGGAASVSGTGTSSLLAALLGLGSLESGSDEDAGAETTPQPRRSWRSGRFGGRRRAHYRLTAEDLEVPDPGSMESVRQGLLTLHTLLPPAQRTVAALQPQTSEESSPQRRHVSPLDIPRQFYRGQWIDCRDTVNQWLEATVVDIVYPEEILPPRNNVSAVIQNHHRSPTYHPATDPAVSAGDLEGRRRLLLEPCEEGDSDDEGGGLRRRDNNHRVQLLLVHYNGWPHRWDEWIRSDSERIRPFRVRTRHPHSSSHASPTPQSAFSGQPPTYIASDDEAMDRQALLPELFRVMNAVNELLARTSRAGGVSAGVSDAPLQHRGIATNSLPWTSSSCRTSNISLSDSEDDDEEENEEDEEDDDLEDLPPLTANHSEDGSDAGVPVPTVTDVVTASPLPQQPAEVNTSSTPTDSPCTRGYDRRELEALAPLLDRLGRTLIDAAPHVASLAASLPDNHHAGAVNAETEAPIESEDASPSTLQRVDEHPTLGGFFSYLSRDRRRQSNASSAVAVATTHSDNVSAANEQATLASEASVNIIDPDYMDFATGMVNTTRGEVRSGPRSRSSPSDDAASLLGAYLAAASLGGLASSGGDDDDGNAGGGLTGLGRLLRERGNGGGIDIHIHAVVTTPGIGGGGGGGGIGLTTMAAGGGTTVASGNSNNDNDVYIPTSERRGLLNLRNLVLQQQHEDDESGIFSDLYSETPEPINPNDPDYRPPVQERQRSNDSLRYLSDAASDDGSVARIGATTMTSSSSIGTANTSPVRSSRLLPNGAASYSSSSTSSRSGTHRRSVTRSNSERRPGMLSRFFRRNHTNGNSPNSAE